MQPSRPEAGAAGLVQEFSHAVHLVPASFGKVKLRLCFRELRLQLLAPCTGCLFQLLADRVHLGLVSFGLLV